MTVQLQVGNVPFPPFALRPDLGCRDVRNADLFFPEGSSPQSANAAKVICYRCPVRRECRDWAIDNELQHGVYGGMTGKQRDALARRRQLRAGGQ